MSVAVLWSPPPAPWGRGVRLLLFALLRPAPLSLTHRHGWRQHLLVLLLPPVQVLLKGLLPFGILALGAPDGLAQLRGTILLLFAPLLLPAL